MAFTFIRSRDGNTDIIRDDLQLKVSGVAAIGDGLEFTNGKLQRCNAQADTPEYVAIEAATATSTSLTTLKVIEVGRSVFQVAITPLVDALTASSGSTTTAVCVLSAGSTDDMVGGTVYIKETNEHRIISGNTYSGGNVTFTWIEPTARAVASGDTVSAVPYGPGTRALKLNSSTPYSGLSNAIADITGGNARVRKVDLKNKKVDVYFRD